MTQRTLDMLVDRLTTKSPTFLRHSFGLSLTANILHTVERKTTCLWLLTISKPILHTSEHFQNLWSTWTHPFPWTAPYPSLSSWNTYLKLPLPQHQALPYPHPTPPALPRLDIDDMVLAQPEATDHKCDFDQFIVTGGSPLPAICGTNTGLHSKLNRANENRCLPPLCSFVM